MNATTVTKSPNRHAHFPGNVEHQEKDHKKILTLRYGKNQMALIRKRLRVESWLYDTLENIAQEHKTMEEQEHKELVDQDRLENGAINAEVDIDIDQMLDMETDLERRQWLQEKFSECKASKDTIQTFMDEFLDRLKTL